MLQWCLTHYWMTFWIVVFLLIVMHTAIVNIFIAIQNKATLKNNEIKLKFKEVELKENKKDE